MNDFSFGQIVVKELPALRLAMRLVISDNPIEEASAFIQSWAKKINLDPEFSRFFGIEGKLTLENKLKGLKSFEYGVSIPEGISVSEDMQIKTLESSKYAVVRLMGPQQGLDEYIFMGWQMLYEWSMKNGFGEDYFDEGPLKLEEFITTAKYLAVDLYLQLPKS